MNIYVYKNEEQKGPFTFDEIQRQISSGELTPDDLGWHEGCDDWISLKSIKNEPRVATPQEQATHQVADSATSDKVTSVSDLTFRKVFVGIFAIWGLTAFAGFVSSLIHAAPNITGLMNLLFVTFGFFMCSGMVKQKTWLFLLLVWFGLWATSFIKVPQGANILDWLYAAPLGFLCMLIAGGISKFVYRKKASTPTGTVEQPSEK